MLRKRRDTFAGFGGHWVRGHRMPKSLFIAAAAAWFVVATHTAAHADTCATFPGSQVYTDQGCDKP